MRVRCRAPRFRASSSCRLAESVSEETTTFFGVMNAETCALIAQILPVFLLVFAVKGSFMTRASSQDVRTRPKRLVGQRWLKDPRLGWAVVVLLFLGFEFFLVLAAAGAIEMSAMVGWLGFGLALAYAAVEFWAAGVTAES